MTETIIDTLPRCWVKTGSGPRDTTTTTTGNLIEGTSLGCLRASSEHLPAIVDALRRPPSDQADPARLLSAWLRETAIQHDPESWESALPVEDWIDDHTIRLLPGGRELQVSRVALAEICEAIAARAPASGWWGELGGTIRDASAVGGAGYLEEVALAAVREGVATRREADHWRALALRLSRRERERSSEVVEARRRAHETAAEAEAARRELAEARAAAEVTRAHDTTAALAALGRALGELAVERAARESLVRERAAAARELEILRGWMALTPGEAVGGEGDERDDGRDEDETALAGDETTDRCERCGGHGGVCSWDGCCGPPGRPCPICHVHAFQRCDDCDGSGLRAAFGGGEP